MKRSRIDRDSTLDIDALVQDYAAIPTLHEPGYITAPVGYIMAQVIGEETQPMSATVDWQGVYYGTKSGEALDTAKVLEGRQRELDDIYRFGVKRDISIQEAKSLGLNIVAAKWLDDVKPVPGDPHNVRSRLVATDVNIYRREDCTQATPPRKVFRMLQNAVINGCDESCA